MVFQIIEEEDLENIIQLRIYCRNYICVQNLVMPYFIDESNKISSIDSMEGIKRFSEESVISEIGELLDLGVKMVALFPVISPQKNQKMLMNHSMKIT